MDRGPTAYAVGCILAPLRGFCLRAAFLRRSAACACGLHSCAALRLVPAGCILASLCGLCLRAAFLRRSAASACGLHSCAALRLVPAGCVLRAALRLVPAGGVLAGFCGCRVRVVSG